MGAIRPFNPVKLFIGVLASERDSIPAIRERLAALYGTIDHESPVIPFDFTDYYSDEMGDLIDRLFFSFERLIEGDQLAEIKRRTNDLEAEFQADATRSGRVQRPVN